MTDCFRNANIADMFEKLLVPSTFRPYAQELVARARPIGPSDRILDLGCGTGIVARVLRERLGGAARITGCDLAAPMIAKARELAPDTEWHEANAMALPFADHSFDLVLSQQMLQFVPEPAVALREIRRVLVPGGRVLLTTWRPRNEQPLFEAVGRLGEKVFGPSADKRWSLDGEPLRQRLVDAGFVDIAIETCSLAEHHPAFPVRASTMAANHDLAPWSEVEREGRFAALEAEAPAVLAPFAAPEGGHRATTITNVAIATTPR